MKILGKLNIKSIVAGVVVGVVATVGVAKASAVISFKDVSSSAWYVNAVSWASQKGLMNGVSNTEFAPDEPLTRAELAQVLKNLSDNGMLANTYPAPSTVSTPSAPTTIPHDSVLNVLVKMEDGKPVVNSKVSLVIAANGSPVTDGYTNANGYVTFTNLERGSYYVSAETDLYKWGTETFALKDPSTTEIIFNNNALKSKAK